MFGALVFSALLHQQLPQTVKVEYHQDMQRMQENLRPLDNMGKRMGRTMDKWENSAEDYLGMGDEAAESFMCSDPGFFVIRQEDASSGEQSWVLKGTLHVPAAGFMYRYSFLGVRGPEAFTQLQVGQPITPRYRQQPSNAPMHVVKPLALPPGIGLLHIRVTGGGGAQQNVRCDLTSIKPPQGQ
jgi:hypothetical protein